jgi:RNA polymerase sigma-70 factor (ECF subfamily)
MAAVVGRYERPLITYAHGLVRDLDAARDVVQDVLIRYAQLMQPDQAGSDVRPDPAKLDAWMFTACRNRCTDHLRKFRRLVPLAEEFDQEDPGETPSAAIERRDTAEWLYGFVDQLSENQRECVLLRFQNGYSYQEISGITGLSVTNVGFILHTALKRLRGLLSDSPKSEFLGCLRVVK